ncbi:hypothetical protein R5R35_002064 [Gryllus longicercus]|uniref:Accessory gland protein n=1 Tax=Gryllus longicercus TaxID=2509291 RepID=A0AAN9VVT8_9ORTH
MNLPLKLATVFVVLLLHFSVSHGLMQESPSFGGSLKSFEGKPSDLFKSEEGFQQKNSDSCRATCEVCRLCINKSFSSICKELCKLCQRCNPASNRRHGYWGHWW